MGNFIIFITLWKISYYEKETTALTYSCLIEIINSEIISPHRIPLYDNGSYFDLETTTSNKI